MRTLVAVMTDEHLEAAAGESRRQVDDFHAEAKIRLVGSVFIECLAMSQLGPRRGLQMLVRGNGRDQLAG